MTIKDQQPICCAKCKSVISQIEPDEESHCRALHWGQRQDYWSLKFLSWTKDANDNYKPENYSLCSECKEKIIKFIKEK